MLLKSLICAITLNHCPGMDIKWTPYDKVTFTLSNAAIVGDWLQTREISTNNKYHEYNPFLGRDPSLSDVNRHFIGVLVGNVILSNALPKVARHIYLTGIASFESAHIIANSQMGIGIRF